MDVISIFFLGPTSKPLRFIQDWHPTSRAPQTTCLFGEILAPSHITVPPERQCPVLLLLHHPQLRRNPTEISAPSSF